ncbi:cytochrome c oxidase assembly protein [Bacillus sp. Bva_UNVM-123]|uniref:cytochrome c oxidase assembly protein n=1 Tax=Bacillus sp. Bva_UNVM-123 TaxID=2829798 RepID=UPI00391F1AD5
MIYAVLLDSQTGWNLPLLIGLACIAAIYIKLTLNRKIHHKFPLLFFLGLLLLYMTIGSPLATMSHLSFSTHMIQMSILYFIIPPILILGIPLAFFQTKNIIRVSLMPTIALFIFAFLFFMYHMPVMLHVLSQSQLLHNGYLLLLFVLSFGMWWPLAAPNLQASIFDNNRRRNRFAHLSGLVIMPACLVFIVSAFFGGMENPFMTHAAAELCLPPHIDAMDIVPPIFNSKLDQLLAGIAMLGLHKLGIFMTLHIGKIVNDE